MDALVELRVRIPEEILALASEVYKVSDYSIGAYNHAVSELAEQWVLGTFEDAVDVLGVTVLE